MLKHVGKMKHNDAKVCVVYRTLPGDINSALVVGTSTLVDQYHNALMQVLEGYEGQQANELGDALSTRHFPDGTNMLEQLHVTGKLVKVATNKVWMTPTVNSQVSLDELNVMIAEQKGIDLNDLSIKDDMPHVQKGRKTDVQEVEINDLSHIANERNVESTNTLIAPEDNTTPSASDLRSRADRLYKEAALLRKQADDIDPPKKKTSSAAKATEAS
jgi:hypothetical protein